jgi:hypothetical protein
MDAIPLTFRSFRRWMCVLVAIVSLFSMAHEARSAAPAGGSVWVAVSNQTLDKMRGGFDAGAGLMVSFGISRAVYINGSLVTSMTLNIGRVSELTSAQIADVNRQLAALGLIQNGPGNSVQTAGQAAASTSASTAVDSGGGDATIVTSGPSVNITPGATVIQNSLNHQQIISQTVISATSNAASIIKGLNLQNTINEAIGKAIGQR